MKTRHPIGGPFSREFSAFVIIAELWRPEIARPGNFWAIFAFFGKFSNKSLFRKFSPPHRSTLLCPNVVKLFRWEIAEIVRYLRESKKNRFPLKLSLLRGSRPKLQGHLAHNIPNFIQIGSISVEL